MSRRRAARFSRPSRGWRATAAMSAARSPSSIASKAPRRIWQREKFNSRRFLSEAIFPKFCRSGEPGMADETTEGDAPPAEEPKYDQAFFLDLARQGTDKWNEWRRNPVNEDVRVTFAGIDFSEAPRDEIDFSGFEFGDDTDFSGCKWGGIDWGEMKKDPK